MFADESGNILTNGVNTSVQIAEMTLGIFKDTVGKLIMFVLSQTFGKAVDRFNERMDEKSQAKALEKMQIKNNCGFKEHEGKLVSFEEMTKNKNELAQLELSYTFDKNGKPVAQEIVYEIDGNGNKKVAQMPDGRPMFKEVELSGIELTYANCYMSDLKEYAQKYGVLCAVGHDLNDIDKDGLYHSVLLTRTKDALKVKELMALITMGDMSRRTLVKAGVLDALNMSAEECIQMADSLNMVKDFSLAQFEKHEFTQVNSKGFVRSADLANALAELQEKGGIQEGFLTLLKEKSGTTEILDGNLRKEVLVEALKELLMKNWKAETDINKVFLQKETELENRIMYLDSKGGIHFLNLNNMEQVHFPDAKSLIHYFSRSNEEVLKETFNWDKFNNYINDIKPEDIVQYISDWIKKENNLMQEKTDIVKRKFQNSDFLKSDGIQKALVDFEVNGKDSFLLSDSESPMDVYAIVDVARTNVLDINALMENKVPSSEYRAIENMFLLQDKYDVKMNDDVKSLLYSNTLNGQEILPSVRTKLLSKIESTPEILADHSLCHSFLQTEIDNYEKIMRNSFGTKEQQIDKRSIEGAYAKAEAKVINGNFKIREEYQDLVEQTKAISPYAFEQQFSKMYELGGIKEDTMKKIFLSKSSYDNDLTYVMGEDRKITLIKDIRGNLKDGRGEKSFSALYQSLPIAYEVPGKDGKKEVYRVLEFDKKPGSANFDSRTLVNQDGKVKMECKIIEAIKEIPFLQNLDKGIKNNEALKSKGIKNINKNDMSH